MIEADWPGFVDLRRHPERISQIAEAAAFAPLADLLLALNADWSPLWTSKCDVWAPAPAELACYIDLLPKEGAVFNPWQQAETFSRSFVASMVTHREGGPIAFERAGSGAGGECSMTLVVRQAIVCGRQGFGITAYLGAKGADAPAAAQELAAAMVQFAAALRRGVCGMAQAADVDAPIAGTAPASPDSRLK